MAVRLALQDHGRVSDWEFKTYAGRGFINTELVGYHLALNYLESARIHAQALTGQFTDEETLKAALKSKNPSTFEQLYGQFLRPADVDKFFEENEGYSAAFLEGHREGEDKANILYRILASGSDTFSQWYKPSKNVRRRGEPWRTGFAGPYNTTINGAPTEVVGCDHIDAARLLANGEIDVSGHGYDETASHSHLRGNWGLQQTSGASQFMFHGSALLDVNGRKGDFTYHLYVAPTDLEVSYRSNGWPVFPETVKHILVNGLYLPIYVVENPEHKDMFLDHEKNGRFNRKLEADVLAHNMPGIPIVNSGGTIRRTVIDGRKLKALGRPVAESETLITTRINYGREPNGIDIKKVVDGLGPVGYDDKRRTDEVANWLEGELFVNLNGLWENRPDFDRLVHAKRGFLHRSR